MASASLLRDELLSAQAFYWPFWAPTPLSMTVQRPFQTYYGLQNALRGLPILWIMANNMRAVVMAGNTLQLVAYLRM